MTQEEKELLAKDICARLPYVIVHTWYNKPLDIKCTGIDLYTNTINLDIPDDDNAKVYIDNCKPYLRPMSSMTEEEKKEISELIDAPIEIESNNNLKFLLIKWLIQIGKYMSINE